MQNALLPVEQRGNEGVALTTELKSQQWGHPSTPSPNILHVAFTAVLCISTAFKTSQSAFLVKPSGSSSALTSTVSLNRKPLAWNSPILSRAAQAAPAGSAKWFYVLCVIFMLQSSVVEEAARSITQEAPASSTPAKTCMQAVQSMQVLAGC
jgi:hypothetical protein